MKRTILIMALLIAPVMAFAIKITKNEIDEFTGQRTVITSWESLDKSRIHVRLRLENDVIYFDFKTLLSGARLVEKGNTLSLKDTEGKIISFISGSTELSGIGEGAVGLAGSSAQGIYVNYKGDINWLLSHRPVLMRQYFSDVYHDTKLSEKDGVTLQKLAQLFFKTLRAEGIPID